MRKPPEQPDDTRAGIRLTAGSLRSRIIQCPQTGGVRPMLNRTRMALFNVLGAMVRGAQVWDCFAGSGLLGLEAVSRGASHCMFIEKDPVHARVVQANIDSLGLRGCCTLVRGSTFDLLREGAPPLPHMPARLVFLDPPHAMIENESGPFWPWLAALPGTGLLDQATVLCVGHAADLPWPDNRPAYTVTDHRTYGSVGFTLLRQA